jgi:formiminotetrahydrofolate cyclodeaminase
VDESLQEWLAALAAPTAAPGGGSAAALMVAAGAALVEMICGLTLGREKFRAVEELMRDTATRAASLRVEATRLREEDEQAFGAVAQAYRLPRSTPEEKAARSAAIQHALHGATETPLRAVRVAVEVLELAAEVAAQVNPTVISDAGAAALASHAGAQAAALNVRINLTLLKDEPFVARVRTELAALVARGAAAHQATLATVHVAVER